MSTSPCAHVQNPKLDVVHKLWDRESTRGNQKKTPVTPRVELQEKYSNHHYAELPELGLMSTDHWPSSRRDSAQSPQVSELVTWAPSLATSCKHLLPTSADIPQGDVTAGQCSPFGHVHNHREAILLSHLYISRLLSPAFFAIYHTIG